MTDLIDRENIETILYEYNASDEFYQELNVHVAELIANVTDEAESDDRKTITASDLAELIE